jgi:flavin reductase (DIM6/NTAB) family NADH-FMN oxidoreductase RutF
LCIIPAMETGEQLGSLMAAFPSGVAVLTVESESGPLALTVSSLALVATEPPLVGVGIRRTSAMHELLREAEVFSFSLLAADQEALAEHFARGVPPIALWEGVPLRARAFSGPPLLGGALGWLDCEHETAVAADSHTFTVGRVVRAETGRRPDGLARARGRWLAA